MTHKGRCVIGVGNILALMFAFTTDNVMTWVLGCFVVSVILVGEGVREYKQANFHKLPLWIEVVLVILTPVIIPIMAIWSIPRNLRSRHVSRTTVRGVFERHTTPLEVTHPGMVKYTKDQQQLYCASMRNFFSKMDGLFVGLPGGIESIYGYDTHCCICLRIGPRAVNRYYIPWSALPSFEKDISTYYSTRVRSRKEEK